MTRYLIAQQGPEKGLSFSLEKGEDWIMGSDPNQSSLLVTHTSPKHLHLYRTPEGIYVEPLEGEVQINGQVISSSTLLHPKDSIQIGKHLFSYEEGEAPSKEERAKKEKKSSSFDAIFDDDEDSLFSPEEPPAKEKSSRKERKQTDASIYDTIFDDLESEEELPFNLIIEYPFLLKVVSGPNAGAEIGLEKEHSYVLGKDPHSSEILFQDLSVSRNHGKLSIDDKGKITLEDLKSKNGTLVNGKKLEGKEEIFPQDLISMGTTVFLVIDRESTQDTIVSSLSQPIEVPKKEKLEEDLIPSKEPLKDWKKQVIPTPYLYGAGAFLLIFFIVFLSFFSLFKTENVDTGQTDVAKKIEKALSPFEDVEFSFNPSGGKLFLVGHVLTAINYMEMNYTIEELPFIEDVENNVIIDEYVWKTANDVLTENAEWKSVFVHSPKAGIYLLSGYVETQEEAQKLQEFVNVNFPYMDRLQNKVVVEDLLNLQIQSLLQAKGFNAVGFQLVNGTITLSGRYNEEEAKSYQKLLKQFEETPGVLSVKNFAIEVDADTARIDITGNYRITGYALQDSHSYSVVVNGQIISPGDVLDGMKITNIQTNAILLEKDGLKYKISYTR